jgi:outer membrane lipoprotein-sorting protein
MRSLKEVRIQNYEVRNRLLDFLVHHSYFLLLPLLVVGSLLAQPTGEEILKKLDANAVAGNRIVTAKMIVTGERLQRTLEMKSWVEGTDKAFTEFLSPPRDAGTKMLKLGDELWTYTPATDRIIKIAGHMLRQSVMGSDLSYEDMLEDRKLQDMYDAEVTAEDTVLDGPCWVVDLTVREEDVAYASRRLWVDRERNIALKEERYAKSGDLLKTTEVTEIKKLSGRWVATDAVFRDVLRPGEGTEFIVEDIEFNARIPDYLFSKAALK